MRLASRTCRATSQTAPSICARSACQKCASSGRSTPAPISTLTTAIPADAKGGPSAVDDRPLKKVMNDEARREMESRQVGMQNLSGWLAGAAQRTAADHQSVRRSDWHIWEVPISKRAEICAGRVSAEANTKSDSRLGRPIKKTDFGSRLAGRRGQILAKACFRTIPTGPETGPVPELGTYRPFLGAPRDPRNG